MRVPRFINRIAAHICELSDPDRIVLFGSYARGEHNAYSDVDLLVIGAFEGREQQAATELREVAHRVPMEVDILCICEADLKSELEKSGSFLSSVIPTGIVVYEK